MTFTNSEQLPVPFGWASIEADDEPESESSPQLQEEDTSFFSPEEISSV